MHLIMQYSRVMETTIVFVHKEVSYYYIIIRYNFSPRIFSPKNRIANIQIFQLCDYFEQGKNNWA